MSVASIPVSVIESVEQIEAEILALWPTRPIPSGAQEEDLDQVETLLGYRLPRELRSWLFYRNGSFAGSESTYSTDQIATSLATWRTLRARFPQELHGVPAGIPIASDGSGNEYILNNDDCVLFIDHGDYSWYVVATSLWRFIESSTAARLAPETGSKWPFDPDWMLSRDAALADHPDAPWAR